MRRVGGEVHVFPGTEKGPARTKGPHFYVNGNHVYRSDGHPDGPSSIPWLVIQGRSVYPGEGYPGGPADVRLFRIEGIRKKDVGVTIRRVRPDG